MPEAENMVLIAEKTPAYFNFMPSNIPDLIKEWIPGAKTIVVLCDPTKRVISDFAQEVRFKFLLFCATQRNKFDLASNWPEFVLQNAFLALILGPARLLDPLPFLPRP